MLPSTLFSLLVLCVLSGRAAPTPDPFPLVDLGYARHVPTKINYTTVRNISYATYSNIRFAHRPIGDLRWRAPKTPPLRSEGVQDGVVPLNATNCVQAVPYYFEIANLAGASWGSEDCLFLDVIVPEGVQQGDSVPVLHWIYGGGFFFGAKDTGGNPASLFDDMTEDQKFVIVASNYRLGALGWMSTSEEPSLLPNAGFYDSLAALEWTRDNIHHFGGDRSKVTVMGQSAGGAIIEHLLAAGAKGTALPFSQAIMSSPGGRPHINRSTEVTQLYHDFLNATNCTDLACLRGLDTAPIAEANRYLFVDAPTDGFPGPSISYCPILDNDLVRDVPMRVLENDTGNSSGAYVRRIISGNCANEGAAITIGNYTSWEEQLAVYARTPSLSTINEVKSIYGEFNGSSSSFAPDGTIMETPFDKFGGDIIIRCHAQAAAKAYSQLGPETQHWQDVSLSSTSYRYVHSVPPATHGTDLNYYFFDQAIAAVNPMINVTVARQFQNYLRRFILEEDLEDWPEYSSTNLATPSLLNVTASAFQHVTGGDEVDLAARCERVVGLLSNPADGW